MKFEGLMVKLSKEAQRAGICAKGLARLEGIRDADSLLDFYTENPDWCLERGFPTWETLREMGRDFGEEMERHGVYLDREFEGEILTERQTYVFLGCRGKVRTGLNIEKGVIPMLYFAGGNDMGIGEMAGTGPGVKVPVYLFGEEERVYYWDGLTEARHLDKNFLRIYLDKNFLSF